MMLYLGGGFVLLAAVVRSQELEIIEKEKLIDDGGKYKNLFKVGEDLKLLPEVMSTLDFSPKDHAAPGDRVAEEKLRSSSHWGRFYVDGWPSNLQYLRAHFGLEVPSEHRLPIVLAEPWDACDRLILNVQEPVIVVAGRGTCTFGTKANLTEKALGLEIAKKSALLLVNNEPGTIHAPGPDAHEVQLSIAMVSQEDGEFLVKHIGHKDVNGTFIPVNCIDHSETRTHSNSLCEVITSRDKDYVDFEQTDGGLIKIYGHDPTIEDEFLLATFGPSVFTQELKLKIALQLCDPLEQVPPGTAIFMKRGGDCSFLEKAILAQNAGAAALVIVNANPVDPLLRPACHPRWAGFQINIPVVLVSSSLWSPALHDDMTIELIPLAGGHQNAWSRLEPLAQDTNLPPSNKQHLLDSLASDLHFSLWPQRKAWLDAMRSLTDSLSPRSRASPSSLDDDL